MSYRIHRPELQKEIRNGSCQMKSRSVHYEVDRDFFTTQQNAACKGPT